MIKIKVEPGQEVLETINKHIKAKKLKEGSISVIGALDSCAISTMGKKDAKKVITKNYHEPFELTGTGEILDGKAHLHITLGREDQTAISGHLEWGKVTSWFVHVYILPLET